MKSVFLVILSGGARLAAAALDVLRTESGNDILLENNSRILLEN